MQVLLWLVFLLACSDEAVVYTVPHPAPVPDDTVPVSNQDDDDGDSIPLFPPPDQVGEGEDDALPATLPTDDEAAWDDDEEAPDEPFPDEDADGYSTLLDCNDNDPQIHPNVDDTCGDNIDQDCDGEDAVCPPAETEEAPPEEPSGDTGETAATPEVDSPEDVDLDGYSTVADCNDEDRAVHPGAEEVCGDSVDQNCNGTDLVCPVEPPPEEPEPEDPPVEDPPPDTVIDRDFDGYDVLTDCDDSDAYVHPFAVEICGDGVDQDCSGADTVCPPQGQRLSLSWQTPFSQAVERITLSGEYKFADSTYGFFWHELRSVANTSSVSYSLDNVYSGDTFRYSVEFDDAGYISWSCIGPYPPGTLQGWNSASVDGMPVFPTMVGDPTGLTTGCGLILRIP